MLMHTVTTHLVLYLLWNVAGKRNEATLWLDLDAEDGPVLGEAEALQPRQVGQEHRVTAQRVHVLVTATLWHGRGQTTATGKLSSGLFAHPGAVSFSRWGAERDTRFISFSQWCTRTELPSPLPTPGFSFLKTVPDTRSVPRAAVKGQLPAHPKKGEAWNSKEMDWPATGKVPR